MRLAVRTILSPSCDYKEISMKYEKTLKKGSASQAPVPEIWNFQDTSQNPVFQSLYSRGEWFLNRLINFQVLITFHYQEEIINSSFNSFYRVNRFLKREATVEKVDLEWKISDCIVIFVCWQPECLPKSESQATPWYYPIRTLYLISHQLQTWHPETIGDLTYK